MSIVWVMLSSHLILCWALLFSIFPSIRYLSNELAVCIRWPKYWSFTFSISPSKEYSWFVSLKISWFNLLPVHKTFSRDYAISQTFSESLICANITMNKASGGDGIPVELFQILKDDPQPCLTHWNYAMLCGATQDGRVMVKRSDRMWSTEEENGKPLQYSCLENPMNSMKRQRDMTLKDELPRSVGAQYATGDQWRNNSRKNEGMEPK